MVASAQMKFASEATLRSVFMPLFGHFMDIKGWVLVYQTEKYQLTNEVCIRSCSLRQYRADFSMPLSGHFMDTGGSGLGAPDREIPTQSYL